jgi:DNA-binding NarL/FixJ family response regulator
MLRTLIADDHAPTRDDVCRALEADPRFVVCAVVGDAVAAVQAALRETPDICLLDVRMPGNGLSAVWEISARLPRTKIVVLTVSDASADLFAALNAGAAGYLLKNIDLERLPHALFDVAHGKAAIPRELVVLMAEKFRSGEPRRRAVSTQFAARLTSREWEVLELLADGQGTAAIARRLVVSATAVRVHISAIVRKLGVADRDEAVALFRRERSET